MERGRRVLVMMICLLTCFAMCMSGCERKGDEGQGGWKVNSKGNDLPEDAPWNHGAAAIMETETGWYTGGTMMVRACACDIMTRRREIPFFYVINPNASTRGTMSAWLPIETYG